MKRAGVGPICLVGVLAFALTAKAISPDPANPYQTISARNVFDLKPIPPPPTNPPIEVTPPSKVILLGISRVFGTKKAFLKVVDSRPQPPGAQPEPSMVLSEGQGEKEIEVLAIDEQAGTVRITNRGQEKLLTFEKDGVNPPSSPGTPIPTMAMAPPPAASNPYIPARPGPPSSGSVVTTFGGRQTGSGTHPGAQTASTASSGSLPSRTLRVQENNLTPEEQTILIEANRMTAPDPQIYPTTELTDTIKKEQ